MVDHSSLAFRLLLRSYGVDLAFTEMIHSKRYVECRHFRKRISDWKNSLPEDRPLIVQLNGNDAKTLIDAGGMIAKDNVSAIDLNLGCPQQIARRGNYGAHLLNKMARDELVNLLKEMVRHIPCPVTVKIRKLSTGNDQDTIELCRRFEGVGVSMITVHGRVLEQSKSFVGPADWEIIRRIKETVCIPVVANGGISSLRDVLACLRYTGADAVMSSEAILENPRLFLPAHDHDPDHQRQGEQSNYIEQQLGSARDFLRLCQRHPPPPAERKSHLLRMLFAFLHQPALLALRTRLLEANDPAALLLVLDELAHLLAPFSRPGGRGEAVAAGLDSGRGWYMRYRQADEAERTARMALPSGGLPYPTGLPFHVVVQPDRMAEVLRSL
jgi:tRNA-dihydrouridine synthase